MASTRKNSGIRKGVKVILLSLTLLFTLSLLFSYTAPFISPERFRIPALFGLAYPILLLINFVFVALWLFLWKKYIWIPLLAIAIGYNQLLSIIQIRDTGKESSAMNSIRVMSFNVHSLYGINPRKADHGVRSRVTDFIAKEHPDLLCIQEFYVKSTDTSGIPERFGKAVGLDYHFYKNYSDRDNPKKISALAIFSRYPIVSVGTFRLSGRNIFGIYTDILLNEEIIRIYNLHLESIRFGTDDYSFYSQLKDAETEKLPLTEGSSRIISKLYRAFPVRARQADIAGRSVHESPYPVIVCGDFNDTPSSYAYHVMTRELKDAFREAGNGIFGSTFAGNFPSFRIDYILGGKDIEFLGYKKHRIDLSDHFPVSAIIRVSK